MTDKQREASSLEKVTDYVEEKEIDSEKSKQAMSLIDIKVETAAEREEVSTVSIKIEDVDLIAAELELPREAAVRSLRAANGDLRAALQTLVNS